MVGERLAEIRKDHDDTQAVLAIKEMCIRDSSCTIFSDIVCLLLSNVCVVTSFYQSLQEMCIRDRAGPARADNTNDFANRFHNGHFHANPQCGSHAQRTVSLSADL